jgi:tetratricopeptide (TPR) repeat protein
MLLARRLLRPLALLVAAAVAISAPSAAFAGGDDFEFGQKLAQARFFKLARRVYETMLSAPGSSETTKDLARYGMATLGYQEALSASARPEVPFAEVVKLYNEAADQIDGFAKKNPAHPKSKEARLLSGQIRLQLVTWCGELLDRTDEIAERKTTPGDVTAAARQAVEAAVAHFDALKGAEGDLGQLAMYHWTTAQYYRALTLDPGSSAQIEALKAAESTLDTYIMDHDGELLAVFAQDMLGLVLAERAKHAANAEEKIQLYQKALTWFQTCIDQEYLDAGTLTVITNGYQHYGKACLEAGRIGTRNFLREGVDVLSQMLQRVPSAGKTQGGIRALLVLGDLHKALGNNAEAVNVYNDASDRAGQIDQRALANEANKRVKGAASGGIHSIKDATVLRKVAESNFAEGRWEEAIEAFQLLIDGAPSTSQAFVDIVWPGWEKIATAYKELGDPLSSAMAYEAIHEAWVAGQIPHKKGDENDTNMRRAGNNRKRFVGLMEELARKTGSKVFQEAMKRADAGFATDYPDHPDSKSSVLRMALEKLKAAREAKRAKAAGWRAKFAEAITLFEGEARNAKSENQDVCAAFVVQAYYQMVYDPGMVEPAPEGAQAAEKGLAFSDEMLAFWASAPGQQKIKDYPGLAAKRADAVLSVRLTRGDLLKAQKQWDRVLEEMKKLVAELGEGEKADDAQALVVEAYTEKGDVAAADEALKLLLKRGKHPAIPALVGKVAGTFDAKFRELTKTFNAKNEELNGTREDRSTGVAAKLRAASARYNDLISQRVSALQIADVHRSDIAAWRKDPEARKGLRADAVKELEEKILPELDQRVTKLAGEISALDTTIKDLTARGEAIELEIQEVINAQYAPLKEAVRRFDLGLQSQLDAGEKPRPGEISNIAARWYAAARNPRGVAEDWEKARVRYEQYIEHPDVKSEPDSDKEKRAALAKLGRIYSHFSEVEKDPAKRAEYVRKAILLLEATLAARPENNELMLGLLNGRYASVVYESPLERGPLYRFILPKVENAAALKGAIAKLGTQESTVPLPKVGDEAKMVVYRRNLAAWKDAVEKMEPSALELLFRDVRGSGLDTGTYREFGNLDREYRTSLAAAYAESGEDADYSKGEVMLATLLQGALSVEDYSDEFWEVSTLALRHFTNHAERLSAAGGVAAKASELRKRARQFITGRTSVASVPTRQGVRDEWVKLIERLNRGLRAEGAPEISVMLERPTPPTPAAAPAPAPAPAPGPEPAPQPPAQPAMGGGK